MQAPDWAHVPYFLAIARSGSLRAAAEQTGGTHATVNRHLRALEAEYGVRLFDRTPTGLRLTEAGQALLPIAEAAEDAMIAARRRLSGLDREAAGRIRVSVPPSLAYDVLPPLLAAFSARHPDIELIVTVTNRFQDLVRAEADVSIRVAFSVDDDVVGRRVLQYALGLYASEAYLAAHWESRGEKGEGLHWIGWNDGPGLPEWVRQSPFPRAQIRHGIREGVLVSQLVRMGVGMSYLPVYAEHYLPELRRVPQSPVTLNRSIWLLLHSDLRETTRVRLFVDQMAAGLKAMRPIFLGPLA